MRNTLFTLLFIIPLFICGQTQDEINKLLAEVSNKMNQTLPMEVDSYTTMMNTYGGMGMVVYNIRLNTDYFNDYGITKSEWLVSQKEQMINIFCSDPSFKSFRDLKVNVSWKYIDLNGRFVAQIKLNYMDCN